MKNHSDTQATNRELLRHKSRFLVVPPRNDANGGVDGNWDDKTPRNDTNEEMDRECEAPAEPEEKM